MISCDILYSYEYISHDWLLFIEQRLQTQLHLNTTAIKKLTTEFGRKRSWPDLRCYPWICLRLRKTTNILEDISNAEIM